MSARRILPDGRAALLLSSHDEALLGQDAAALLRYLDTGPEVCAVAAMLLGTRRIRRHRLLVRAADTAELAAALRAVIDGEPHPLVVRSSATVTGRRAFVFPGQGGQWPGMGAAHYRQLPEYRSEADRCAAAFGAIGAASPLPHLITAEQADGATQLDIQGAQFIHALALARVWEAHGLRPELTVGHSLGEIGAAHLAGAIGLSEAVSAIAARAGAVEGLTGHYGMAVLGIAAEDAETLIAETPGWLELSVVNSPSSVVVSGDREAVAALTARVGAGGAFVRELPVDFPAHTSRLESAAESMAARLPDSRFAASAIPFVGSATGAAVPAGTDFADYWRHNLRTPVRFDRSVQTAVGRGARTFVELSAHPALLMALAELTDGCPEAVLLVGSGRRDGEPVDELAAGIAAAAIADPDHPWSEYCDPNRPRLPGFPNAPMKAERLWLPPRTPAAPAATLTVAIEKWEPVAISELAPGGDRWVAVVGCGAETPLARRLTTALSGCSGVQLVSPAEAETLLVVAPELDHPDVARSVEELTALAGDGLLEYLDDIGAQCRDIWLLTVGGEQVAAGEPVALPAQAALAAMHRSIGSENADLGFLHLDLPSWDLDPDTAAIAVAAVLTDVSEAAVRIDSSGPVLYRRLLIDAEPAPALRLDAGLLDEVVITGGSGGVGMHFARYLAERGARRIVLLSRRGADPAAVTELSERHNTTVVSVCCDLTDPAQVKAAAAEFSGAGATLLVHAAAVATLGSGTGWQAADFAATFGAKVLGMNELSHYWPLQPQARILLCSSVSGVWGGRGHPAYPAANRMLDVLAGQLRAKNLHCVSIRWGLWPVEGIADAAERAQIARSGLRPMPPDLAIETSLHDYTVDPMVMAIDADRLRIFVDSQLRTGREEPDHGDDREANAEPVARDIPTAVRGELAGVLRVDDPAELDLDTSLFDLGIDSLLALDLRKRLQRATGRKLALATLLGGVTGSTLIAELLGATERSEGTEKVDSSRD